eukprot:GEMP01052526.1.p1 GENE.GEMP01052526.1~~GEMP01052526.1.p1  ORF type:complete len:284 (+),score=42.21 GEMP01052526.1:64-915(+)
MIPPLGGANFGAQTTTGPPPQTAIKLRPVLMVLLVGGAVSLIGKFIGEQQSTSLSDLFPIIFGCVILYSERNFHMCLMSFLIFAGMAFIFGTYYLINELVSKYTGGSHYFEESCPASYDISFKARQVVKICGNRYDPDEEALQKCTHPMTCFSSTPNTTKHMIEHYGYLYTDKDVPNVNILFDQCSVLTIIGHSALIASVIFNGLITYVAWKMFKATRDAAQVQSEQQQPLNDPNNMDPQPNNAERNAPGNVRGLNAPSATQGAAHGSASPFQVFQGQGQRLG